jgi:hypothetical protein
MFVEVNWETGKQCLVILFVRGYSLQQFGDHATTGLPSQELQNLRLNFQVSCLKWHF